MNHLKRWLTVVLVAAAPLLVAGIGCDTNKKQPKVEGNDKLELKPLPAPAGPGDGKKAGNAAQ